MVHANCYKPGPELKILAVNIFSVNNHHATSGVKYSHHSLDGYPWLIHPVLANTKHT